MPFSVKKNRGYLVVSLILCWF